MLDIMWRLNHNAINNSDVEVYPSEYQFESSSDFVPDPDNTMIKSTDDYEMDQILELLHSEHDNDLLDVYLHMLQYWLGLLIPQNVLQYLLCCFIKMEEKMLMS